MPCCSASSSTISLVSANIVHTVRRTGHLEMRKPEGLGVYGGETHWNSVNRRRGRPKRRVRSSVRIGGAEGIRTPDPLHAKQVLSQLSYSPKVVWDTNYMHGVGGWIGGEGGDGWKTMSQWGRQCVE